MIIGLLTEYSRGTPVTTPKLTVDVILFTSPDTIVLVNRKNPPYGWALPGGFVDAGETTEQAAIREAAEETGLIIDESNLALFNVYSDPSRDPRGHTVTIVYTGFAEGTPIGADDAKEAKVFSLNNLPENIAFDHREIIQNWLDC